MGFLNTIGAWFEKITDGWVFGTPISKFRFTKNVELEGTDNPTYTHEFQDKDGILAHLDDIPDIEGQVGNLQQVTNNGNETTHVIIHTDGIEPNHSATVGQLNEAIENINIGLPDKLLDGGIVQWKETGFDFEVSTAILRELGVVDSVEGIDFTLDASDPVLKRIDVPVVSLEFGFEILKGEFATVELAQEPQVIAPRIRLTAIDVNPASTTPDGITTTVVYKENLEYTVTHIGAGSSNPDDTSNPFEDLKAVNVSNPQNGSTTLFTAPDDVTVSTLNSSSFRLDLKEAFGNGHNLAIQFFNNADVAVSDTVILNINKTLLDYQFVAFSFDQFNFGANTTFRKIALRFVRTGNQTTRQGYFIDNFILQGGITQPPITDGFDGNPSSLNQEGATTGQAIIWDGTKYAPANIPGGGDMLASVYDPANGAKQVAFADDAYTHPNHSGDVTSVSDGATTIANDAVTNAKAANMAENTIKGRITTGTGDPEDLTASQVRTIINVADGANNYVHPNHSGDVTSTGDGATVIADNAVTNAKAANMPTLTIKGNDTGSTADPKDLTAAEVRALLNVVESFPDYEPSTGNILFSPLNGKPRKYGFTTALTGNITFETTGAKETTMIKAKWNGSTLPTVSVSGGGVTLIKIGDFVISVDNYIDAVCHKNDSGTVTAISYSITQA